MCEKINELKHSFSIQYYNPASSTSSPSLSTLHLLHLLYTSLHPPPPLHLPSTLRSICLTKPVDVFYHCSSSSLFGRAPLSLIRNSPMGFLYTHTHTHAHSISYYSLSGLLSCAVVGIKTASPLITSVKAPPGDKHLTGHWLGWTKPAVNYKLWFPKLTTRGRKSGEKGRRNYTNHIIFYVSPCQGPSAGETSLMLRCWFQNKHKSQTL